MVMVAKLHWEFIMYIFQWNYYLSSSSKKGVQIFIIMELAERNSFSFFSTNSLLAKLCNLVTHFPTGGNI